MEKKLKQAIALIESAMADIKQSEIAHENMANNMFRRQLKGAVESILSGLEWKPSVTESTKVNSVTASSFLDWYFTDEDDTITIGNRAIDELNDTGTFTISVEQLFDECGYIPQEKCENNDGDNEYDPSQIELINDL
jgi:DNA-directed RNA polymerase specialized sigma54-like protein